MDRKTNPMTRISPLRPAVALAGAAILSFVTPALAQAPAAATGSNPLPEGAGRDTMIRVCSTCHAPELAATERHDAKGWTEVVQLMATRGAMASDAEFNEIVGYLARAFPASPVQPASSQGAPRPSTR